MNNKLIWIFLGLLLAVIIKISVDVYYTQPNTVQTLNAVIEQQKQKIATLNDQLIVLQRTVKNQQTSAINATPVESIIAHPQSYYPQEEYLKDYLNIIQLQIQQQQFDQALLNIQNIKQKLSDQPLLNEAMHLALIDALEQDQQNVQIYVKQRVEHLFLLQQQLNRLENLIQAKPLDQQTEKWNIASWFSVEKANNIPELENRYLQYRYLQLKTILAQNALSTGQISFYRQQINDIKMQIQLYSDQDAKKIIQQLTKVENLPLTPQPQMSAVLLMSGN